MAVIGLATALYGFVARVGADRHQERPHLFHVGTGRIDVSGLRAWILALGAGASVLPRHLSRLSVPQRAFDPASTPGRARPPGARTGWLGGGGPTRRRSSDSGWRIWRIGGGRAGALAGPAVEHVSIPPWWIGRRACRPPRCNALSSLAQWEERQLGAGRFLERAPDARDQGQGIVGRVTEWTAGDVSSVRGATGVPGGRAGNRLDQPSVGTRVEPGGALVAAVVVLGGGDGGDSGDDHRRRRDVQARMRSHDFPLLSALLVVPLFGIIADFRARQARTAFALGLTVASVELVLAVQLVARFQPRRAGDAVRRADRNPALAELSRRRRWHRRAVPAADGAADPVRHAVRAAAPLGAAGRVRGEHPRRWNWR
ncbi:MAG: hypothetical protein MZV63_19410 [Marinilabiliales bacterium]|nr:hypothetical protein [Marinilabiliales bacterium]